MIIALCRGKGIISALIRWQTWSRYSHVAAVLPDGSVIEAWPGKGVHRRPFWSDITGIEFFKIVDPRYSPERAQEFLHEQIGQGYDYLGVLRFLSRRRKSNDKWFCSELIFRAASAGGALLLRRIAPPQVSPGIFSLSPGLHPTVMPLPNRG